MSRKEFIFNEKRHQPRNGWQNNNGGYHQNNHTDRPKNPKKNKPHNEVVLKDGEYTLNPSLTKAKGHIEMRKGLSKTTIKYYNADLRISVKGGKVLKLEAYYQSNNGLIRIKDITPSTPSLNINFLTANIPNNQLKVTVDCEIEIGRTFLRKYTKHLKASCFLNI